MDMWFILLFLTIFTFKNSSAMGMEDFNPNPEADFAGLSAAPSGSDDWGSDWGSDGENDPLNTAMLPGTSEGQEIFDIARGNDPLNTAMIVDPAPSTPRGTYASAGHDAHGDAYDSDASDASHADHKRAAEAGLDTSPFKKRAPFSPNTNRLRDEVVRRANKMQNTPKKTKQRLAAQIIRKEAPNLSPDRKKRFKGRLQRLKVIGDTDHEVFDSSRDSELSSQSTVTGSPNIGGPSPLGIVQTEIGGVAHTPTFAADLKDLMEDPHAAKRMKAALDMLSPDETRPGIRFVDAEHLEGDAHGGGHLVEDQRDYQAYVEAPTRAEWGVGPQTNPETGVTSGIYQGPTNPKAKHSTLFPRGMSARNVWEFFQNTRTIATTQEGNRSLEVGTTQTGIKMPIEVHHKAQGVMSQPFPIWSLKNWKEKIPGITIGPADILAAARESYNQFIRPASYDPIRYGLFDDEDKNIIFDVAPMEGNPHIPKGAYVTIPKKTLEQP
jgi:hypothetical protein